MKNIWFKFKNSLFEFINKVVKKLNNFQLTSIIISIISVVIALVSIGYLLCYEFAGYYDADIGMQITAFAKPDYGGAFKNGPILGMIFFLFSLISIILSIVVVYVSFPAIVNKDIVLPRRSNVLVTAINGAFQLVISILTIVLLTSKEYVKTKTPFTICLVFSIIAIIACALCILPFIRCTFYMPAIKVKAKKANKK